MKNIGLILLYALFPIYMLNGQAPVSTVPNSNNAACISQVGNIYGQPLIEEQALCLVASKFSPAVYFAGKRGDNSLLIKMDYDGRIIWSREFNIVPENTESPAGLIEDSEGMIVITGTSGNTTLGGGLFGMRYDPNGNNILWAHEYNHNPRALSFGLMEKGPGGNYVLNIDAIHPSTEYAEVFEIDRGTGLPNPDFAKRYHLVQTETLYELVWHNDAIYGVGRYKDGPGDADMRHTLTQLSSADGSQAWVKLGHRMANESARLYGTDLVIHDNSIFSIYRGDPDGTSTTNTNAYVQRTSLAGDLIWTQQYELPGNADYVIDLVVSDGGIVVLNVEDNSDTYYLYKIDTEGNLLWARSIEFPGVTNALIVDRPNTQLIEAGNQLFFIGFGTGPAGDQELVIVRTDLEGNVSNPCILSKPANILVRDVPDLSWYDRQVEEQTSNPVSTLRAVNSIDVEIPVLEICSVIDTLYGELAVTICEGETFEEYTVAGIYQDTFITNEGCDSIRTLTLSVTVCQPECENDLPGIYGQEGLQERGLAITAMPGDAGYYVAGTRGDSVLIMAFDVGDQALWTRIMDAVPDEDEYPVSIITDSEGMIVMTGMAANNPDVGGPVFAVRFDPTTQTLLWNREINSNATANRVHGITENGPGGNYIISNNSYTSNRNYFEPIELERTTGALVSDTVDNYLLGTSAYTGEFLRVGDFLYGPGRYSLTASDAALRYTITKMDATTLKEVSTHIGPSPVSVSARLYAYDLVIDNGFVYAAIYGDHDGSSTSDTELYLQKSTLSGELIWLKQYEVPFSNVIGIDMVKSGDDLVMHGMERDETAELFLLRITSDGELVWARQYDTGGFEPQTFNLVGQQLISLQGDLLFVATSDDAEDDYSLVVVRTDPDGISRSTCIEDEQISVIVRDMVASFDTITLLESTRILESVQHAVQTPAAFMPPLCVAPIITSAIEATICEGEIFEDYSEAGIYQDTFITNKGCDSIRILTLTVEKCGCGTLVSALYGTAEYAERGYSLSPAREGDGYYVCGIREDSVLLFKRNLGGEIDWSVTLDIEPNRHDHPISIITDTAGMIAIAGMTTEVEYAGGDPFALRYDPYARQILWIRKFDTPVDRDRVHSIFQNTGEGNGNYLMLSNPVDDNAPNDDFLITELDPATGASVNTSTNFNFNSSEFILDLDEFNGNLYGVGRYTDGALPPKMRNTLTRLDPATFAPSWTRLGHIAQSGTARLYGFDLVVDNFLIYSGYYGDNDGQSVTQTGLWLQCTRSGGDLVWLKQYDLPGSRDLGYEIIKSGDGFVVLAVKTSSPGAFYLFKIDRDGNVQWARSYAFSTGVNTFVELFGASQLIQVGDQLVFTGYTDDGNDEEDLIIIETDLEGHTDAPCVTETTIDIPVTMVANPVWYPAVAQKTSLEMPNVEFTAGQVHNTLPAVAECSQLDTITAYLEVTICSGLTYEGYSEPGIYIDTFLTSDGCDSLRVLTLHVTPPVEKILTRAICPGGEFLGYTQTGTYADTFTLANGCDSVRILQLFVRPHCNPTVLYTLDDCRSYMSDNSHMDYSEFTPEYPEPLSCATALSASVLHRTPAENKHSCTPGLNNTAAMCISSLESCTYDPGNNVSLVFEVNVTPEADSLIEIDSISFFEKAPPVYNWIDGPTGPNNYPQFFGIRILLNGVEIYERHDLPTTTNWSHHRFEGIVLSVDHLISGPSVIRIELLPYCTVDNGSDVAAWDVEDVKFFMSCFQPFELHQIEGEVKTYHDKPVPGSVIELSKDAYFNEYFSDLSASEARYGFDSLDIHASYHLRAFKSTELLEGISTLDLIALQKHLLGKESFSRLDQYIAADVNRSGKINVTDVLDLRKSLLGILHAFPNNTSWRMGQDPIPQESSNMNDFRERVYLESLSEPVTYIDWVGVKVGDVNGDVDPKFSGNPISSRSADPYIIRVEEMKSAQDDDTRILNFIAGDHIDLEGFQLAVQLPVEKIEAVQPGILGVTPANFFMDASGLLRFSWSEAIPAPIAKDDLLFSVIIKSAHGYPVSDLLQLSHMLAPEVYATGEARKLMLTHDGKPSAVSSALTNIHITPNPFTGSFNLNFDVPQDGKVAIDIINSVGQRVYAYEGVFEAGSRQHHVDLRHVQNSGVLICRMAFGDRVYLERIVQLN